MNEAPIIVTGASGFVGSWLIAGMARSHPDIPVIATSSARPCEGVEVLDVTDADAVGAIIATHRPRAVIHLAALAFVPDAAADPIAAYRVNLFGAMNVADAILRHAPSCRMIFAGSAEVYGDTFRQSCEPLDESALLAPNNLYAVTKAAADLQLGQYAQRGLEVVRFRPFNHIGPGQSDRFAIASFVEQIVTAERRESPELIHVGNLSSVRDFLDVRDVVAAYVRAATMETPLSRGTILNLASGRARTIGSILDQLIVQSRRPLTVCQDPARMRPSDTPYALGDASRAAKLLGWTPAIAFEQTLSDLLQSARSRASMHLPVAATTGSPSNSKRKRE